MEAGTASTDVMEAPEWVECYSLEEEEGTEELWKLVSKEQQKGELIRAVNRPTTSSTQPATPPSETPSTLPSGTQDPTTPSDAPPTTTCSDAPPPTTPSDAPPPTTPSDVQQPTLPSDITSTPTNAQDSTTPSDIEVRTTPSSAPPSTAKPDATQKPPTFGQALKALASACSRETLQDFLKDKKGKVLGERRLVHFIDTGGQSIYHDIHPILITSPSIYLVVFSLKDFYEKDDEKRKSYFKSDLIQRPLRSIYTFGTNTPEKNDHLQLHPEAPKIFIVGTHLDQIPPDSWEQFLETVDEMIEEEISSNPYHQFVQYDTEGRSFWAVDNTQAGRKQDEASKEYISTLRLMVQDRSMEMSVRVPLTWMLLKMVMDSKGVRYCKYSKLLREALIRGYVREDSPDADLDTMLRLFHTLGLIYHKVPSECSKENSLVFIDPDCLYSATSDFLMAAREELEDSQGGSHKEQHQTEAATKGDTENSQGSSGVEKHPYQICTGGIQQIGSDSPTTQKPRQIQTIQKILGRGVESLKVIQRIGNSFSVFLFDMHTMLCSLERILMNVGQEAPDVVLQSLKEIQEGLETKNSPSEDVNTLQSKYRILAQEMVFKLMNSVRRALKSSEDKTHQLDSIIKEFWCQCRMARRSIELVDFNHLLLLLTELRIIAELNQPDCYVIPAALPKRDLTIHVAEGIEPLLFTLISDDDLTYYLPSGMFCCLINELVTVLRWTVLPLGRAHVAFKHDSFSGEMHVIEHESYIEIKLESDNAVCKTIREQIGKRIDRVYSMIYDPPKSRSTAVVKGAVVGFKCNCGRGTANTPHLAVYEEDKFECCTRCLLQGPTKLYIRPLTSQQKFWFADADKAGMQYIEAS